MRARTAVFATLALAAIAACGSSGYGPNSPGDGGGGPAGSVTVGSGIRFTSRHNGSANPAVDTITAGAAVTWSWSGTLPHSVRSIGAPAFASSDTRTGGGTYVVTFATPGTYHYDCVVHGAAMTGTVVVLGEPDATATLADPAGDAFGSGVSWDLTALTATRDADAVTVALELSRDIVTPIDGDTTAMLGFVDLDVDQDASTGGPGVVDQFRLDGAATGLGVDYIVQLRRFDADSTVLLTTVDGAVAGRVKPAFDGRRVTVRVPVDLLGDDDGFVSAAAIVGNIHNPTDFAPKEGHLALGGAAAVASRDHGTSIRRSRCTGSGTSPATTSLGVTSTAARSAWSGSATRQGPIPCIGAIE